MAQPLTIELKIDHDIIATAYYKWDGYTPNALKLCSTILDFFNTYEVKGSDILYYTIRLLEKTGATLQNEDRKYTKERYKHSHFKAIDKTNNDKRISITSNSIHDDLLYNDYLISIDLITHEMNFGVIDKYNVPKDVDNALYKTFTKEFWRLNLDTDLEELNNLYSLFLRHQYELVIASPKGYLNTFVI